MTPGLELRDLNFGTWTAVLELRQLRQLREMRIRRDGLPILRLSSPEVQVPQFKSRSSSPGVIRCVFPVSSVPQFRPFLFGRMGGWGGGGTGFERTPGWRSGLVWGAA